MIPLRLLIVKRPLDSSDNYTPSAVPGTDRAHVLGVPIDRLDMDQTIVRVERIIAAGAPAQHYALSPTTLVALHEDAGLREIALRSPLVSADGWGIVWTSRWFGDPLPERVTGLDLMERLLDLSQTTGYRSFILGATEAVLARAIANIESRYPKAPIAGFHHGYFARTDEDRVVRLIRDSRADMLFVAMSSPQKEYWIDSHAAELGVPFISPVGGGVDIIAGVTRRAPVFIQRSGLEWLFRVVQEPRRLARRFFVGNMKFAGLLAKEVLTRIAGRPASPS